MPSEFMIAPGDLASELREIRHYILSRRFDLDEDELNDMISEVVMSLMERGRRQPNRVFPRTKLMEYAVKDATRAVWGDRSDTWVTVPIADHEHTLSVASSALLAEYERERHELEINRYQRQEWTRLSLAERQSRIIESYRATLTTIPVDLMPSGNSTRAIMREE